jgi:hypothetical protein
LQGVKGAPRPYREPGRSARRLGYDAAMEPSTRAARIASVRQFLWTHFPDGRVRNVSDLRHDGQLFTVVRPNRDPIQLMVANEVLEDEGAVPYLDQGLVSLLQNTAETGDGVRLTRQRLGTMTGPV